MLNLSPRKSLWLRRVTWLISIWAGSIAVLATIAVAVRVLMSAAGIKA